MNKIDKHLISYIEYRRSDLGKKHLQVRKWDPLSQEELFKRSDVPGNVEYFFFRRNY